MSTQSAKIGDRIPLYRVLRDRVAQVVNDHIKLVLLGPALLALFLVFIYPVVYMFYQSFFFSTLGAAEPRFVGLANYVTLFEDPAFTRDFVTTLQYSFGSVTIATLSGLAIALAVKQVDSDRLRDAYISLIMAAWAIPLATAGLMWRWIFHGQVGILNKVLRDIGLVSNNIAWTADPTLALMAVIFVDSWVRMPFAMIVLYAGLQSIPEHMYDAVKVDGATTFEAFRHVTIPYLRPSLFVAILINWMFAWRAFDIVFTMTKGGPGTSTEVLSVLLYRQGMELFNFGYTNAVAVILVLVTMVVGAFYVKVILQRVDEE
ncbi:MAG: sugar ABC transporter permease [Natronomonas sp.]|uniref:carbohydrate ABC transporter permease n=1 Tax=Natronomonas sp. TaxID=2184060 RepID=UPI00286FB1B6|nr:sugar ABC transporter permease [Natronomonas sp.]MDR9431910.1 sugar ABC transporter permease [Natronomonas sp.]